MARWAILLALCAGCGRSGPLDGESPAPTGPTPTPTATPNTLTLIDEQFDAGSDGLLFQTVIDWDDGTFDDFEVYGSNGAGARGMRGTYDHDGLPTAEIAIPGAIEVNADEGNLVLVATFLMPAAPTGYAIGGGTLRVWAGRRGNAGASPVIEVYDVTAATTITGEVEPQLPTGAAPRTWIRNEIAVPFAGAHAGHTVEVRFDSPGNSAEGLELADLLLTANLQ